MYYGLWETRILLSSAFLSTRNVLLGSKKETSIGFATRLNTIPGQSNMPPPDAPPTALSSQDPRSSSTQSLAPNAALDNPAGRRRLLLVYIHGFMGNESSFRSFPAHVHNLITLTLAETHIVHTKIYPRYRSRNALEMARDEFSTWSDARHACHAPS